MLYLRKSLGRLADVCSADVGRASMMGVRVLEYAESYRLEATDGRRLLIVRGPNDGGDGRNESIGWLHALLEDAPDGTFDGLIPAKEWSAAFRSAKANPVGLVMGDKQFSFGFGQQTLRGSLVEGRYPDVRAVLPRKAAPVAIRVDARLLASLLMSMAAVRSDGDQWVDLHFYGSKTPMGLSWRDANGMTADAILMPLIPDAKAMDPKKATQQVEHHEPEDEDDELEDGDEAV